MLFPYFISKEYFAGDAALKAGGKDNTMNQFG
jgi:isocitrate lyase